MSTMKSMNLQINYYLRITRKKEVILLSNIYTLIILFVINFFLYLIKPDRFLELCTFKHSFNLINFNLIFIVINMLFAYYLSVEAKIQYKRKKYYYILDKDEYRSILRISMSFAFGVIFAFFFIFLIFNYTETKEIPKVVDAVALDEEVLARLPRVEADYIRQFYTLKNRMYHLNEDMLSEEDKTNLFDTFVELDFKIFVPEIYLISMSELTDLLVFVAMILLGFVYFFSITKRLLLSSMITYEKFLKTRKNVNYEIFSAKYNNTDLWLMVLRIANIAEIVNGLDLSHKKIINKTVKYLNDQMPELKIHLTFDYEKGLFGYLVPGEEEEVVELVKKIKNKVHSEVTINERKPDFVLNHMLEDVRLNDDIDSYIDLNRFIQDM